MGGGCDARRRVYDVAFEVVEVDCLAVRALEFGSAFRVFRALATEVTAQAEEHVCGSVVCGMRLRAWMWMWMSLFLSWKEFGVSEAGWYWGIGVEVNLPREPCSYCVA